jgi:outer membrane immunogenic protein
VRRFAAVADFSAEEANNVSIAAATGGQSLTLDSFLGGIRYRTPHGRHAVEPFVQVLLGGSHAIGSVAAAADHKTAFAARTGGGVDLPLGSRFEIRLVQVDYYLTTFSNAGNNHQNNLLLGTGLVLRWPSKR